MTDKEKEALKCLQAAFRKCSILGFRFAGMDNSLMYANKTALKEAASIAQVEKENGGAPYNEVAVATQNKLDGSGDVKTYGAYLDSGGM